MVRSRRYVALSGTRVFPAPADKAGYLARRMVGESIKRIERREVSGGKASGRRTQQPWCREGDLVFTKYRRRPRSRVVDGRRMRTDVLMLPVPGPPQQSGASNQCAWRAVNTHSGKRNCVSPLCALRPWAEQLPVRNSPYMRSELASLPSPRHDDAESLGPPIRTGDLRGEKIGKRSCITRVNSLSSFGFDGKTP